MTFFSPWAQAKDIHATARITFQALSQTKGPPLKQEFDILVNP
jgi:hypothetical protein